MSYPSGRYPLAMLVEMVKGLAWLRLDVQVFDDDLGNQQIGGAVVVDVLGQLKTYQIGTADGFRYGVASVTKLVQAVGQYGGEFVVSIRQADLITLDIQKVEPAQTHYLQLVALRRRVALYEREKLKAFERDRQLFAASVLIESMRHGDASEAAAWLEADTQRDCVANYLPFLTAEIVRLDAEIAAIEAEGMPETGGIKRQIIIDAVYSWQDFDGVPNPFLIGRVPAGRSLDSIKIEVAAVALDANFSIYCDGWAASSLEISAAEMANAVTGSIDYALNLPALETERDIYLIKRSFPTQGAARFVVRCD